MDPILLALTQVYLEVHYTVIFCLLTRKMGPYRLKPVESLTCLSVRGEDSAPQKLSEEHGLHIGVAGWVKKQRLLSNSIAPELFLLGKIKMLSGTLLLCGRYVLPK